MGNLEFLALHFVIDNKTPNEKILKPLFLNENNIPFTYADTEYSFTISILDNDLYWIYAKYGKQFPYDDEVINAKTRSKEQNPKSIDQIELNHQLFGIYDAKDHDFYLNNIKKKSVLEAFFSERINSRVDLKYFYKTPTAFFSEVVTIDKVRFVTKSDLFNSSGNNQGIEPNPINAFGFGAPEKWDLTAHFRRKHPTQDFINKISSLFDNRENGSIEKLICQGYDDKGIEKIFNLDSFTHKIKLSNPRPTNEYYNVDDVKTELVDLLKGK